MKILQINAVGQASSTGRNCKELSDYINFRTSHRCYTAFAQGEHLKYTYQIGNIVDWKIHALMSRITGKQAFFSKCATKKLIHFMDKEKFDVVHLGNLHGNYINLPLLLNYLAKKDIPTVITLHDCWFFTGKCFYYTVVDCNKWMSGCGNCPKVKVDNVSWFFDTTAFMWKEKKRLLGKIPRLGIIGVSEWITNEARKSLLKDSKYIKRIYNWVDLNTFKPYDTKDLRETLGLRNKFIILGVASKWDYQKGLNSFIELANMLAVDEVILLVGKMEEQKKLPNNIISVGEVESVTDLAKYYSLGDVFVTLSLQETFGKVSAEALACGTPVVCFNSTANKELPDCYSGVVVEIESGLNGISNAIHEFRNRRQIDLKEYCRNRAVQMFNRETNIQEHIKFYDYLISNR